MIPRIRAPFRLLAGLLALVANIAGAAVYTGVDRVVAVGDVHGDFDQLVALLRAAEVVDDDLDWIAGEAHLVQTGDILDRGPDSRKAMDLLIKLEKQALAAGGRVHALIGNHEAMNLTGDRRYISPGEYAAFVDDDSEAVREIFWKRFLESRGSEIAGLKRDEVRKRWEQSHPLGYWEHVHAMSDRGDYGKWIRGHDTVVRIDDTLFVHGGISSRYAKMSLKQLNDQVRAELAKADEVDSDTAIRDPEGPLWYRGLARGDAAEIEEDVDRMLEHFGVERIVIGHTTTDGAVMPRLDGRILLIDVGLSALYGGRFACLSIEEGKVMALHRGTPLELPADDDGLLEYLRRAAALDPEPSPLLERIEALEATAVAENVP